MHVGIYDLDTASYLVGCWAQTTTDGLTKARSQGSRGNSSWWDSRSAGEVLAARLIFKNNESNLASTLAGTKACRPVS